MRSRPPGRTSGATYSAKLNWLTTITPRLGHAAGPWLAYVKGGLAAGEVDSTMTGSLVPTIQVHEKNRQLGWTAGAGVEYAVWNRWVVGIEYNYYDVAARPSWPACPRITATTTSA